MVIHLKVTVWPDFKKELIEKVGPDEYRMYLREPAERGLANKKVLKVLQELFPGRRIRIVNGALTQKKLIEIR